MSKVQIPNLLFNRRHFHQIFHDFLKPLLSAPQSHQQVPFPYPPAPADSAARLSRLVVPDWTNCSFALPDGSLVGFQAVDSWVVCRLSRQGMNGRILRCRPSLCADDRAVQRAVVEIESRTCASGHRSLVMGAVVLVAAGALDYTGMNSST